SLIYGTTGLTNFAHAEFVTFGAIIAVVFAFPLSMPMWLVIPLSIIAGIIVGYLVDLALWRPLKRKGLGIIPLMIVTIGLSLAVRYIFQFIIGGNTIQLPGAGSAKIPLFGSVGISPVSMMSMAASIVVLVVVALWLIYSRIGKATRAISDNPELASASGI